jgi:hypothetical protein
MLISFTNANDETFDIQNNYILQPDWDLGSAPVDHQMAKAPYQDGETYIDTIFEPNNPTISFAVIGNTRQNIFDRCLTVQKHFNPKLGLGTLKWIQDDGTTYYLDCIPLKPIFPSGEGRSHNHQIVIIQFIAPNPFWYDPTQLEQIMVGFSGGFSLPFSFPFTMGTVGSQVDINNLGNIETPVLIYFYGEVVNPVMQNLTTGEDITITKTIDDGDVLIINTAFGEKSVMILSGGEYTNAFEFVDPDSVFWKLAPGDNTLKYTVSSEGANAECRLYYYHRFSGV